MGQSILYVVGQLSTGGLERQIVYLMTELQARNYSPAIVVWNYDDRATYAQEIRERRIPILSVGAAGAGAWSKLRALRRLIYEHRVEVVHAYSFYLNIATFLATRGTYAVACGAVQCDFDFDLQAGPIIGPLCAALPRTQVYNNQAASTAAAKYPPWMQPKNRIVVRNGMDLRAFPGSPLPDGPPWKLVGVGRLAHQKRWDVLLRALRALRDAEIDVQATIVGGGPQEAELKALATTLGLERVLHFAGDQRDVRPYLQDSHCVVLSSDAEGVPNALMEAMASGRAIVATCVGDVPWMVDHERTGYVVPSGDPAAFAEHLMKLLNDPKNLEAWGKAARRRAEREFSIGRLADETLDAYVQAGWRRPDRVDPCMLGAL